MQLEVDGGHVGRVMAFAGRWGEFVESGELVCAQLNPVGGGVLFDSGHAAGAGGGGDVVAAGEDPGERGLGGRGTDLCSDGADFVDDGEVAGEVLPGEAWVGLAPVIVGEVVDGADLSGEQAVAERGIWDESDAELT